MSKVSQEQAQAIAADAWADMGRYRTGTSKQRPLRSPTDGTGAWAAQGKQSFRPMTFIEMKTRLAELQVLKARHNNDLKRAYQANIQRYERPADDCRYYPHQSEREMARRQKRLALTT